MLMPKKVKHRKQHRGRTKGIAKGATEITYGDFGIQALEPGWITARQIEAGRIAMTRHIKRGGKVWINVFPDKPRDQQTGRDQDGFRQRQPRTLGRRRKTPVAFSTNCRTTTRPLPVRRSNAPSKRCRSKPAS